MVAPAPEAQVPLVVEVEGPLAQDRRRARPRRRRTRNRRRRGSMSSNCQLRDRWPPVVWPRLAEDGPAVEVPVDARRSRMSTIVGRMSIDAVGESITPGFGLARRLDDQRGPEDVGGVALAQRSEVLVGSEGDSVVRRDDDERRPSYRSVARSSSSTSPTSASA